MGADDSSGSTSGGERPARRFTRRRFIQYGAASAAGTVLGPRGWVIERALAVPKPGPGPKPSGPTPSLTAVLRRREDQLRLRFEFFNLKLDSSGPKQQLVRQNNSKDAHIVVVFEPQHVMEEAFFEKDPNLQGTDPLTTEPLSDPPVGARLAGATRLSFKIPPAQLPIAFTPDSLLEWEEWMPQIVPVARGSLVVEPIGPLEATPKLAAPGTLDTAIELPWWLVVSPHKQTGWAHSVEPVTRDGVSELWHTRLGGKAPNGDVDEADAARMTIRAVWARDPDFKDFLDKKKTPKGGEGFALHPIGMPFRTPLSPKDRLDLVVSMADYEHKISAPTYLPLPAEVDSLMLSTLGAWLDTEGEWNTGLSGTSLEAWRHRATMGRDHYVRVVRAGFLFPFGHGASLIKVTERKFRTRNGRRIAYLFQRYFLIVRQPVVKYGGQFQPADGRGFPFTSIRITTSITPNLDKPGGPPPVGPDDEIFVPRVGGTVFRFHMVGTDPTGRTVDFEAPVVFVDAIPATKLADMGALTNWYNALNPTDAERTFELQGAKLAVAPPGTEPGSTDLEVHRFTVGAQAPKAQFGQPPQQVTDAVLKANMQPAFFPTMAEAEIRLAAAEVAVGDGLGGLPVVVYNPDYVQKDFSGAGPGEVFVNLKNANDPAGKLDFGGKQAGDRSGGVITPNIGIRALSRRTGTVGGDPSTFQGGNFQPNQFFPTDATILGDITLAEVIEQVTGGDFDLSDPSKKDKVVQLTTREEPTALVTELSWKPKLKNVADLFIASLDGPASLDLSARIVTPKGAPDASTFTVVGDLRSFQVGLLPGARFILVQFDRLRFQSETDKKTDVDVEIREVLFDGPLKFVNQLKDYLSFSAGGFSIELQPTHLNAGFQIPLPSITVGVFSLTNISFVAGTTIPFTGQPVRFRFGFSTKEDPFLISVMIFGGGGFFQLGVGADGVEEFLAALEFGLVGALDLGVASGSVAITAGIYFAIGVQSPNNPQGAAELTGFIKLKGEVEVLGLITVALLMEASFTYIPSTEKAIVKAVIIVEIDITIWSGSVEIEYEKKIGGSGDPTFFDMMPLQADWDAYADAFVPIGA